MAAVVFGLDHICGGGEHVKVTVVKDGGASRSYSFTSTDLLDPLTEDQLMGAALVLLRFRMQGKTRLQARNDLQAGFTVTI
jgi:hypothetical protein